MTRSVLPDRILSEGRLERSRIEKFGGYILCFNGARIMNVKTKEVVYQQRFPQECIAPLYEYALQHECG